MPASSTVRGERRSPASAGTTSTLSRGPGVHLSRTTGEMVEGSPLIALNTTPPFSEYHFIDADPARAEQLRAISGPRKDVHIYSADCNDILLNKVFPNTKYSDYRRALLLLDPYNINLKWEVIETAGKMGSVEVFLNLMIMDINRNALRKNRDLAVQSKVDQLTRLWGDGSWEDAAYSNEGRLFDDPQKVSNEKFGRSIPRASNQEGRFQVRLAAYAHENKDELSDLLPVFRLAKARSSGYRGSNFRQVPQTPGALIWLPTLKLNGPMRLGIQ